MTNIQPQADKMNRGAWLKTEMMVECWRNEAPVTVVGGAVFLADGPGTAEQRLADHPWEVDRTEWFVESHNIKNPAYFWKVIVLAAETDKGTKQRHQAFWMPNHESATAKKVNDYLVSIPELEQFLTDWGAPESFTLDDKELFSDSVWKDPRGCNRM
jgi:endonuclease G